MPGLGVPTMAFEESVNLLNIVYELVCVGVCVCARAHACLREAHE